MSRLQPLTYPVSERVLAFSTTRHGGVGKGNYASMNVTHYCGDNERHVQENRRLLAAWLGIAPERIVLPRQTHQTEVRMIAEDNFEQQERLEGVDALVTRTPGICIGVSTADCIPILLYDAGNHIAAAIHAGWRGTVGRIAEKVIQTMKDACRTCPEELHAVIGPGISLKAFEVGDEVYETFREGGFDMPHIARRYPVMSPKSAFSDKGQPKTMCVGEKKEEKWHIDLVECNRQQLLLSGIPGHHIRMSGICTFQQHEEFFSARRLGIHSGRIFTGIMLQH